MFTHEVKAFNSFIELIHVSLLSWTLVRITDPFLCVCVICIVNSSVLSSCFAGKLYCSLFVLAYLTFLGATRFG